MRVGKTRKHSKTVAIVEAKVPAEELREMASSLEKPNGVESVRTVPTKNDVEVTKTVEKTKVKVCSETLTAEADVGVTN